MQVVIRKYSGKGARPLFNLLEKNAAEVEALLRSVAGFVSYTLARSRDGGFTVTVCEDKEGIDESIKRAKEWVAKNAAKTGVAAPEVTRGTVVMHLR